MMWVTCMKEMARWDQRLEAGPLAEWRRTLGPDDGRDDATQVSPLT